MREFFARFDLLDDVTSGVNLVVSLVTSLASIACMQIIARQEWRGQMMVHAQRFALGLLAVALLLHGVAPYIWGFYVVSMLAVVVALLGLLLVTALFSPQGPPQQPPKSGVGGPKR